MGRPSSHFPNENAVNDLGQVNVLTRHPAKLYLVENLPDHG
jgi:hypothetical protein